MSSKSFDVVVVGAGPGGYVSAIKLGQLGLKTAVVEQDQLGGVCLNVGCIPSKALIHASSFYDKMKHHADELGIDADVRGINLEKLITWKSGIVKKLTGGIGGLLKANGVEVLRGRATFEGPNALKVVGSETLSVTAKYFVIATGSRPFEIPGFKVDGVNVITSTEALDLKKAPKRLVVIGGGYIGLELGSYFSKVGSTVTVLEGGDRPLAAMDADCVNVVTRRLKKRGVTIVTGAKAKGYKKSGSGKAASLVVAYSDASGEQSVECDAILVTVGRTPNSENLGLERLGLKPNARGFIEVDAQCRTKVPHVFAIGDVAGGMMLAHKASKEGLVAAEVIAGKKAAFDTKIIPAVVFTDPEIAAVGYTLAEAKQASFDAHEASFPFGALGKALASGESDGFVKVVADRKTQRLLGVHMVGAEASALLGEAGLALEMGAVLEDLAMTIHAHPTLPEALMEAAEVALGHPIHIVLKK